MLRVASSDFL